jgi:hypothetical protein
VSFTDQGRLIRKPAFLNVLNISATRRDVSGISDKRPVLDNGQGSDAQAGDGLFTLEFGRDSLRRGVGELVIRAKGQTFTREKRMTYEVVPPIILEAIPAQQGGQLRISMRPDEELVDPSILRTSLWLEDYLGRQYTLETTLGDDGVSRGTIDLMAFSGSRGIFVQAVGKTLTGARLEYLESPIELEGLMPPPEPVEPVPAVEPVPTEPVTESPREAPEQPRDEPTAWHSAALWFGLLNLVLAAAGAGGYWWLRKQNKQQPVNLVEDDTAGGQNDAEGLAA